MKPTPFIAIIRSMSGKQLHSRQRLAIVIKIPWNNWYFRFLLILSTIRRHSSFAVVTSKSYNPFLNLEHSMNREQGFLAYLPVNSEILFNLANSSIWFSLYRPNNLVSGVSLKSRTLTITTGRILRSSDSIYHDLIISEGDPHLVVCVYSLNSIANLFPRIIIEFSPLSVIV